MIQVDNNLAIEGPCLKAYKYTMYCSL